MKKIVPILALGILGAIAFHSPAFANKAQLLIERGSVSIKREGWNRFAPARNGMKLGRTDLLRSASGARAVILCPDGKREPLTPNTLTSTNNKCKISRPIYRPGQLAIGDLKGGSDRDLPYIIAPRSEAVLTPIPKLQWNPVSGATGYTVSLEVRQFRLQPKPDAIVWTVESQSAAMEYPATVEPLQSGLFYRLIVVADTGQSSTQVTIRDVSFVFAPQADIREQLAAIETLKLPPELAVLAKADILLENQFWADAIAILQDRIEVENTAALSQRLGDVYLASGLRLLAEAAYLDAIARGNLYADVEIWLESQFALAQLYERTNEPEKAIQRLRRAELAALYLCDRLWLERIHQELLQRGETGDEAAESCPVRVTKEG